MSAGTRRRLRPLTNGLSCRARNLTRGHAIRRLVALGLTVKSQLGSLGKPARSARAQELATKAIEKIGDPAAPPEERAQRRRQLTKALQNFGRTGSICRRRRGNDMRMLVAFLIALGAIYLWDANYNDGSLTAGAKSMLQDIERSIR